MASERESLDSLYLPKAKTIRPTNPIRTTATIAITPTCDPHGRALLAFSFSGVTLEAAAAGLGGGVSEGA
jgi:hypothetical protein